MNPSGLGRMPLPVGLPAGLWRFLACSVVIGCHKLTICSVVNWTCDLDITEDSLGATVAFQEA
jgi:hypothetical protein